MDKLYIQGGRRLVGDVTIHGAKNSALPLLVATLLTGGVTELYNCPRLSDVDATLAILRHLGCRAVQDGEVVTVDAATMTSSVIPDRLMREMRSSILFLGAVIARCGCADLTYPGGCELGPRPIDLHLSALRRMGVHIEESYGHIRCRVDRRLHGAEITLTFPSVGATENILLAACTADGVTVLRNAAREPEIHDLCGYLNACGAHITETADGVLRIEGVSHLHGCSYTVLPDRIEAATYLAAAAVTGGSVTLRRCEPSQTAPVFPALEESGCRLSVTNDAIRLDAPNRLRAMGTVRTMPYPGFPTDAAAPLLAASSVATGTSMFVESIFANRYNYVDALTRMGAHIRVDGRVAVVEGVPTLQGTAVSCTDLRGGAAMVVAALAAQGQSIIGELCHLDRGYSCLTEGLSALGACIRRADATI